jgi:hypothetical protein
MWGKESPNGMNICKAMTTELRHYYAYQLVSGAAQCCQGLSALGGCMCLCFGWCSGLNLWLMMTEAGGSWQAHHTSCVGLCQPGCWYVARHTTPDEQHRAPPRTNSCPLTR